MLVSDHVDDSDEEQRKPAALLSEAKLNPGAYDRAKPKKECLWSAPGDPGLPERAWLVHDRSVQ